MRALMQWWMGAGLLATLSVGIPSIIPPPAPGDSGDSGLVDTADSGDSGDSADTGPIDTGPVDTGPDDTGPEDSGPVVDTADTGLDTNLDTADDVLFSAADQNGEKGGFGCASVAAPGVGLLWMVGLGAAMVRRRNDANPTRS